MRSLSKPILITCDLLFIATIIFLSLGFNSKATPHTAKLYYAASLLCLIACVAAWIFGLNHEARKKKTQSLPQDQPQDHDQSPDNTPHD